MLYSSTVIGVLAVRPVLPRLAIAPVAIVSLLLCGCGSTAKPARGRGQVDSPITTKTNHLSCLQQQHLPVQVTGPTSLQIGALPNGPTVQFVATPGAAQALQITDNRQAQGAEVIGNALLYPHGASDGELKQIETCLDHGVSG